ncbi:MAG: NAD-dependent epimerase/dehydratase family protein [Candidatus Bathyarchaeia archaeon]|jgi:UDP-glucose 4-epimerase|nr:NAD-dependent epimerase/dehydratase family protein [Candidatus Bathyarchaeota archaeon A05DMB-4]MDH7596087.1 NAD-dependent epimerase/dehydratase family protein [Candidatus Bathyarchaeota archaeon]
MSKKALITGGAGFIGSHLTERLLKEKYKITIIDNFSSGKQENLRHLLKNPRLEIVKDDLKEPIRLQKALHGCKIVFHFAANPEVRIGETEPKTHFDENLLATFNLLESIRKEGAGKIIVFASTSTIYGEPEVMPTSEDYGPLIPISTYGASKLGCEALITSFAYTFGLRALIFRLANIVGPNSTHGVIIDFINKIRKNPKTLEILGDGTQTKSYLYITDCIDAVIYATKKFLRTKNTVEIYNVGSQDQITVKDIAKIVAKEMRVPNIKLNYTGGIDGGRGWKGDVKIMNLSIEKLRRVGWTPKYNSVEAVKLAAKSLSSTTALFNDSR